MGKFIQYEIWKDCNNHCAFCFNKGQKLIDKRICINRIMNKLDDPEVDEYDEIGFIGGEFFDNQLQDNEIKILFYNLLNKVIKRIQEGKVNKFYLTSSLLFNINNYLTPLLDYFRVNNVLDKVLLCTSYDLKYRFHTEKLRTLWENNMIELHTSYPELRLHTEMIVTELFMNAILNQEFDLKEFKEKYHTALDFIETSSGLYYKDKEDMNKALPDFFPRKATVIKFLKYIYSNDVGIDTSTFLNKKLHSDKIYNYYNGKETVITNRHKVGLCPDEHPELKDIMDSLGVKYEVGILDCNKKIRDIVNALNL